MKLKTLVAASCLATTFIGAIAISNGAYAASPSITINNDAESLYVETGTKTSADSKAVYDSSTKTLTLDNFNGDDILVKDFDELTITLKGQNTLTMATKYSTIYYRAIRAAGANLKINGTGSLVINGQDINSSMSSAISASSIDIEQANLKINAPKVGQCLSANNASATQAALFNLAIGSIQVKSGNIQLACKAAFTTGSLIINDGQITVDGKLTDIVDYTSKIQINGGVTSINNGGILVAGGIDITGGTLNIHGADDGWDGIEVDSTFATNTTYFKITGGNLNIDNVKEGISLSQAESLDSSIEFLGGTTKITAKTDAVIFSGSKKNEKYTKNITIKDNMYLLPEGTKIKTGNFVKEYYYIESKGQQIIITDDKTLLPQENTTEEDKKEITSTDTPVAEEKPQAKAELKAPDTGAFGDDNSRAIIVTISLGLIAAISGIAILAYVGNRIASKVRFDR